MSWIFLIVALIVFGLLLKVLNEIKDEFIKTREMLESVNEKMLLQNEQNTKALKNIYTDVAMHLKATSTTPAEIDINEIYEDAKDAVIDTGVASASYLQRSFRIGYAKAAQLLDLLESRGVIGPADGAKPREVLIEKEELE